MNTPILEALLDRGMLPVQLPPGFTSESFAAKLPGFRATLDGLPRPKSSQGKFSVPRSSYFRRNTALVNPIAYFYLADAVASKWSEIEAHFTKSPISKSIPGIGQNSIRAIQLRKFGELYEEKIRASSGFKYALITDITSFFPTIYTHTIPWAVHGKDIAKVNRENRKPIPTLLGNLLDRYSQKLQDEQTIGLPIGPDTSHILAEIIGVSIDTYLHDQLGRWPDGFRYVDDFYLFASTREEAEKYLAAVTRAIASHELQISPAKTRIIEVRDLVDESWKYGVKKLRISSSKKQQRDDIHHYFEVLFALERRFKDESLVKYGLKQASSTIIKKSNWDVFEAYLLKCGYSFPNTIQVISQILFTYFNYGYPVSTIAIIRFCETQLSVMAANDCHGEVAWLLWICRELTLPVSKAAVDNILSMNNPISTLILLDLESEVLWGVKVDKAPLAALATKTALWGPNWMLAYEAGRRKWLGNSDTRYIDDDPHFGAIKAAGVEFFDPNRKSSLIFDQKEADESIDFDSDDAIEKRFDFDENDEEYFDSARRSERDDGDDQDEGFEPDVSASDF